MRSAAARCALRCMRPCSSLRLVPVPGRSRPTEWQMLSTRAVSKSEVAKYNARMEQHARDRDAQAMAEVYKELQKQGLSPDHGTFVALIRMYALQRDHASLLRVPVALREAGIQADVAIYNRIIQAFGKQGEAGLGFMALTKDDMEAAGLKPNQGTFNALLDAYTVAGDAVAVANTKTEMALAKEKGWFAQDVYGLAGEEWEAGIPRK